MNREAIGSFLFIGGFEGRCSTVDGGDCAICNGFGGRAEGEAANFRGVTGAGGAATDKVRGPDDGGAGSIDCRLYVTVLTVTRLLVGLEGPGAGGFKLGELASMRCCLGGSIRAVYIELRSFVASLLVF